MSAILYNQISVFFLFAAGKFGVSLLCWFVRLVGGEDLKATSWKWQKHLWPKVDPNIALVKLIRFPFIFIPFYFYVLLIVHVLATVHIHTHTHIYLYIYRYIYVYKYIYICLCVCVCVQTERLEDRECVWIYIHVYVRMSLCVCSDMFIARGRGHYPIKDGWGQFLSIYQPRLSFQTILLHFLSKHLISNSGNI